MFSFGNKDLPRCQNMVCGAYINPFVLWSNNEGAWECNFCNFQNILDQELNYLKEKINCGSYELIANPRYHLL